MNLRETAHDQPCVRCGVNDGTTVLAHYFGPRRGSYGGGMGVKGSDAVAAILCQKCHYHMDTLARDKERKWELSEEMLHCCALTWIRWVEMKVLK
jgi:hypothetical protein